MNMEQTTATINPVEGEAILHIVRDMILLALDETEAPNLSEVNRCSARAALVEALETIESANLREAV